jgi:hypothetical protein
MVQWGIAIEFVPWSPIFEKCPHLREKGGVLTKFWPNRNSLSHTVQSLLPDTDMHGLTSDTPSSSVSMANAQWACYAVRTQSRAGRAGARRGAAGQLQAVNADARPETDPFETQ